MPHFGLMRTEDSFATAEGALMRARLHIRGGRRRLREGKVAAGIITLYDALLFALRWYFFSPERKQCFHLGEDQDLMDDRRLFDVLKVSGRAGGGFDYDEFNSLVETALKEEMSGYPFEGMLRSFEELMVSLGVMPFDEEGLPPEDPATF